MELLLTAVGGFCLDLLLGDPAWVPWPHPVVVMGRCITALEKTLRPLFPQSPAGQRAAGRVLAAVLPLGALGLSWLALWLCGLAHPALRWALATVLCWQALAMRDLAQESRRVHRALAAGSLAAARTAVGRIVGRDTASLTAEGVTKAAVETVAENFSDGVIAPLFYMLLGGAPLALCYKAINTMDSMVGYKNEAYLHFGRAAAKLDDAANWLPARLAALLLILAAPAAGLDGRAARRIWRRDRRNHASPNSAQCEAAMAGALGVQLAGPAYYFGQLYQKPTIGDALRPVQPGDILAANRLLYAAGLLGMALLGGARALTLLL